MSASTSRHPFLDHPGPIPFAHRGGADGPAGENTLSAFEIAVDTGYRYLETDVHATSDGVLLAFHDRRLQRVTDAKGRIRTLAAAEVAAGARSASDPIPTMAELLETFPDARFNIDVKEPNAIEPLTALLRRARRGGAGLRQLLLRHPAERDARRVRARAVHQRRAARGFPALARLAPAQARRDSGPGACCPHVAAACLQVPPALGRLVVVDERLLAAAHAAGLPVHVWTVNEAADMERLLDLGADGIMTDRLDTLKTVLTKRGTWS